MATDEHQAPRIARAHTSMADAAAANQRVGAHGQASLLVDFRICGVAPFGASPSGASAVICAQIFALSSVLAAAYLDADAAQIADVKTEALASLPGSLHASAHDAIGSLAALAAFFLEQHRDAQ